MFTQYGPSRYLIGLPDNNDPTVFPFLRGQSFLTNKTPTWSTNVQRASSGRERATQLWLSPLWSFKVGYEFLDDSPENPDIDTLYAFFNSKKGKFIRWKYLDPSDYKVTNQPFGTGDGSTRQFQLLRSYSYAGQENTEPVYAVRGTPILYLNGVKTTAFTMGSYGNITMNVAPPENAILTWTGEYYFLCRFDQDDIDPSQMVSDIWSLDGVTFTSVRP